MLLKKIMNTKFGKMIKLLIPIAIGCAAILCAIGMRKMGMSEKGETTIITNSTLKEVVNISQLSTSKYIYRGIAPVYKDKEKKKIECHVRYKAEVKVGIDMGEIEFDIDDDNKIVKPILPELKINLNSIDTNDLSFIPEKTKVELSDVYNACEKDAEKESKDSKKLWEVAQENLKENMEALLNPILEPNGYSIVWE